MVLPKRQLALGKMPALARQFDNDVFKGRDWVAIPVCFKATTILFISVYFDCTIGPTGDNMLKMRELLQFILQDGRWFVIAGDWNMSPLQLQHGASHWLKSMHGAIVVPTNAEQTCNSGRILDFVVASIDLMPAISVYLDLSLPWRSHNGLRIEVHRRPASIRYRALSVPVRLDKLPDAKARGEVKWSKGVRDKVMDDTFTELFHDSPLYP